jgi:murein DD-endopeptidase MepM/ murein hydrolase activator NlpD
MRYVLALVLLIVALAAGLFVYAGQMPGPAIAAGTPVTYIGQATPFDVVVTAPGARLSGLRIAFEQNGKGTPLYALEHPVPAAAGVEPAKVARVGADGTHVTTVVGRASVPDIKSGAARIVVSAERPVLFGLRTARSTQSFDVQVRLERPAIAVLSTKHYINLGGTEMIVYRVTPLGIESGVQVGNLTYPGYPASGAKIEGVHITDPNVKVAFFALLWNQDVNAPMFAYAKDEAGNTARAEFDHTTFPKPFKKSTIQIDDKFINRAVPWIYQNTTDVKTTGDPLQDFLQANGKLRQINNALIASMAKKTSPEILWGGDVFLPFSNNAVEAAFADSRTYMYNGKEVDKQTHLGFDLARVVNSPIFAANAGTVVYAAPLGIYGNCIIIDHGMGVQSLYGHLSSLGVKPGDTVRKEQQIGVSGQTGMAGGDHLHFTMLVNGQMVNPVEWWDAHWIQDRILRKLREASGS